MVVAVRDNADVHFASDSKINGIFTDSPQWVVQEPVLIATTNQILLQSIYEGLPFSGEYTYHDIVKYISTVKSNFPSTSFEMLIGGGGNLFYVKDFVVLEVDYMAIGEGAGEAMGALYAFEGNERLRAEKAVRAAIKYSTAGGKIQKRTI